jgi:DNA-binding NarL/FixJ family response regulator
MAVRILIADDHKILREGLRAMFGKQVEREIVGEAEDGVSAVRAARELRPDIIILDINMPEMDGIEVTQRLLKELPETKIIALSMFAKRAYVTGMLEAGASGYVLKGGAFSELAKAVDMVLAGEVYLCPHAATILVDRYMERSGNDGSCTSTMQLTDREQRVLRLLADGKTTKEMALLINMSSKTVDASRRQIMDKLELNSMADLVKYAIREGLTSLDN